MEESKTSLTTKVYLAAFSILLASISILIIALSIVIVDWRDQDVEQGDALINEMAGIREILEEDYDVIYETNPTQ